MMGWFGPRSSVCTWKTCSPTLMSVLKPELIALDSPRSRRIRTVQSKVAVIQSSFDRALTGRYYTSATKMNSNYLDNYGPLLLMFILAGGLSGALLVVSTLVGRHKPSPVKDQAYECGITPTGD